MLKIIVILSLLCSLGCDRPDPPPIQLPTETSGSDSTAEETTTETSLLDTTEENREDRIDKFTVKPPADENFIVYGMYRSKKPPSWFWVPPKSSIVTSNYVVPSINDQEHAIFSVTQFELGEGGHFTENVARWKSLFRTNAGAPVKPTVEVITVNGHDAVIAEFKGEYMGAGAAWHLKNHALLVAEVREPEGNVYFKLLGPSSTVEAHRAGFLGVLDSLEIAPETP